LKSKNTVCRVKSQLPGSASNLHCSIEKRGAVATSGRYLLDGKMDWFELFKKSKEFAKNSPDGAEKVFIRTQLSPGRYAAFAALAEEWGLHHQRCLEKIDAALYRRKDREERYLVLTLVEARINCPPSLL
jgi:hypothetical protein